MSHFFARWRVKTHTDIRVSHVFRVLFSHVRVFFYSRNVQKRATKSDTSYYLGPLPTYQSVTSRSQAFTVMSVTRS